MKNALEESAKNLSFKLSEKLEKKEITIGQMASIIDGFLTLSAKAENIKELEDFVKKYD